MHPPESTEELIDSTRKRVIVYSSFLRADALVDVCEQLHRRQCQTANLRGLRSDWTPSLRQFVSICWFNSLSIQYSQTLLTLFSKSFSSFPRGTCALSDSVVYKPWVKSTTNLRSNIEERDSPINYRTPISAGDEGDVLPQRCFLPKGSHPQHDW